MDLDKGLAFNLAVEEIARLTNDIIIYKTIILQRDNEIKALQDRIKDLESNK